MTADLGPLPEPYLSAEASRLLLGPNVGEPLFTVSQLEAARQAAYALGVERERERCAKLCDTTPPYPFRPSIEAAHAIRKGHP